MGINKDHNYLLTFGVFLEQILEEPDECFSHIGELLEFHFKKMI